MTVNPSDTPEGRGAPTPSDAPEDQGVPMAFALDPMAQDWLDAYLSREDGIAGTVHRRTGQDLEVVAARNIPPPVLQVVSYVPRGKGMAGQAQVTAHPVQTCNLQTDDSGTVNPMAKLVGGQAAAALPVLDGAGDVRAIVGIAFAFEGEIPEARIAALWEAASSLPE